MAARLQSDIRGRAGEIGAAFARVPQRNDLRVVSFVIDVRALANDLAVAHHDAAHLRIGRRKAERRTRQLQRPLHEPLVDLTLIVRRTLPNTSYLGPCTSHLLYFTIDSTKAALSKGRMSSIFSPTPTNFTGRPSSVAMASTIPPLAVPSSLVSTIPVTRAA